MDMALSELELVHKGYMQQLQVETVAQWADGYIDYGALLKKVGAIRLASSNGDDVPAAVSGFVSAVCDEIRRSGSFFANEVTIAALRLRDIVGTAPQPALDAATRHGCASPATMTPSGRFATPLPNAMLNAAGNDKRNESRASVRYSCAREGIATESERGFRNESRPTVPQGSFAFAASFVSRHRTSLFAVPEDNAAARFILVSLRELLSTLGMLLRFAEIQIKCVRHAVDEARLASNTIDESVIAAAVDNSPLTTELPSLYQLEAAVNAEIVIVTGGAAQNALEPQGPVEAYDWVIKWRYVALSVVVLIIIASVPVFTDNHEAHNCAAIIGCATVLWVTEAMPYFATALLIPLLAVPMKVLPGKGQKDSADLLLGVMFKSTQVLVLGGLCMGKALSKHHLEEVVARVLLRRVARHPALYLLSIMTLSALLCAVISNVAAPVLVMSVVQPSLWELPEGSGAAQAILLGVAFACNFGGMLTPIASPQNAVAQDALGSRSISFGTWIGVAVPIVAVGIVLSWALVLLIWRPFRDVPFIPMPLAKRHREGETLPPVVVAAPPPEEGRRSASPNVAPAAAVGEDELNPNQPLLRASYAATATISASKARSTKIEIGLIVFILLVTVTLWCVPQDGILGNTGVVALIPIVCFFGIGVLSKADFNSLSWHLVFLLSGGNMLGTMAKESKLLIIVIDALKPFLVQHSTYEVMAVLIFSVAGVTTFVSHTVSALLLMPVVVLISETNPELPSAEALVILTVIMCSGAMGFPFTSFPNINSLLTEARDGKPFLVARHFILPGFILTALVVLQLTTYMVPLAEGVLSRHSNSTTAAV